MILGVAPAHRFSESTARKTKEQRQRTTKQRQRTKEQRTWSGREASDSRATSLLKSTRGRVRPVMGQERNMR
jgi:hypothetical protein